MTLQCNKADFAKRSTRGVYPSSAPTCSWRANLQLLPQVQCAHPPQIPGTNQNNLGMISSLFREEGAELNNQHLFAPPNTLANRGGWHGGDGRWSEQRGNPTATESGTSLLLRPIHCIAPFSNCTTLKTSTTHCRSGNLPPVGGRGRPFSFRLTPPNPPPPNADDIGVAPIQMPLFTVRCYKYYHYTFPLPPIFHI